MKKRISLILLLSCIHISIFCQTGITGYLGMGKYALKQEKELQREYLNTLKSMFDLDIMITNDFPAYWNYALEYYFITQNSVRFALGYMYQSSGGRAWYQDYSGIIKYDIISEAHGPYFSLSQRVVNRFLFADLRLKNQVLFGKSTHDYELKLNDHPINKYTNDFTGVNFGVEPAVVFGKNIFGVEFLMVNGYHFDLIQTDFKDKISRWDGWRISIGIGYYL